MWIPIRQKPGFGTLCNAIVIGLVFDLVNGWIGDRLLDAPFSLRMALLVGGIVLNGAATAVYLGAHFGPGPRDGLMTGLVRRTGRSVRLVRTIIEGRSEEHTSELQSLMRISYADFCLTKQTTQ